MNRKGTALLVLLSFMTAVVCAQDDFVTAVCNPADCDRTPSSAGPGKSRTDPTVGVKINNLGPNVEVGVTQPVMVEVAFEAGSHGSSPCDVWLVCNKTSTAFWRAWGTVGGGSWGGMNWGGVLFKEFFSGTLSTIDGFPPLLIPQPFPSFPSGPAYCPLGAYSICFALETANNDNGFLEPGFSWKQDWCNFTVLPEYRWDDGSTENLLGITAGGELVGMHRFDVIPGGETINEVGTIFGSPVYPGYGPANGTPTDFYIWEDYSDDKEPTDCVLVYWGYGTVNNVDLDIHWWDAITPTTVMTSDFWVGYNLRHNPGEYCLGIDTSTLYLPGSAYLAGSTSGPFDPNALYSNQYPPIESTYGLWTVRARY